MNKVLLDTNVIYPVFTCDLLLWLACHEYFQPFWTPYILKELNQLIDSKVLEGKKTKEFGEAIKRRIEIMNEYFSFSLLRDSKMTISADLDIVDEKDLPIILSAIANKMNIILTWNLKHFNVEILKKNSIEVLSPDQFIKILIESNGNSFFRDIKKFILDKKYPPISVENFIDYLKLNMLSETAILVKNHLMI